MFFPLPPPYWLRLVLFEQRYNKRVNLTACTKYTQESLIKIFNTTAFAICHRYMYVVNFYHYNILLLHFVFILHHFVVDTRYNT